MAMYGISIWEGCRYLGPDYGDLQRPAGEVALADLPRLAHESLPLCMLVRHAAAHAGCHMSCSYKSLLHSADFGW